tara:strand:- start:1177 stop:1497 length:321 start_codon:yes stop_codon:yes gene_type:complete
MTQAVAYKGSDCNTGHGCDSTVKINGGSGDVIIGGLKSVARKDDPLEDHAYPNPGPPPDCIPHLGQKVNEGSATVFVNDRPIARVGDSVDVGGEITEGISSVVAGG